MNLFKKLSFLSIVLLLVFTACRKDENIIDETRTVDPPEIIINASVNGTVTNSAGLPVEGAQISVGTNLTETDERGFFILKDINMNEFGQLINIEKEGYFKIGKFVNPKLNKMSYIEIVLTEKEQTGSFAASNGGIIQIGNGANVSFPANAIKTADGSAFTGTVNVYSVWMNPTDDNTFLTMPGDLRAFDLNEEFVQLATYGMIGVELESSTGQKLNIADGQKAELTFPIPSSIADNAPSTIELWSYDTESGYWVEEGTASVEGNNYVAEVSHFSFWNCDVPYEYVDVEGTVVDEDGNGVSGLYVLAETEDLGCAAGYTNEDGVYAGKMPANVEITLTVYDDCFEPAVSVVVGPFTDDAVVDPIELPNTTNTITVSGTLVDCDNNPVSNGYVYISTTNTSRSVTVEDDGTFSDVINVCSATEIQVYGVDIDNLTQSTTSTHDVSNGGDIDLGNIQACEDLGEFLTYTVDGYTEITIEVTAIDSMDRITVWAQASNPNGSEGAGFELTNPVLGDNNPVYMWLSGETPNSFYQCQGCSNVVINLTELGSNQGEFIVGTISGEIDGNGGTFPVSGSFRIELDN